MDKRRAYSCFDIWRSKHATRYNARLLLKSVVLKHKILNKGKYKFVVWKLTSQTLKTALILTNFFSGQNGINTYGMKSSQGAPHFSKLIIWQSQVPSPPSRAYSQSGTRSPRSFSQLTKKYFLLMLIERIFTALARVRHGKYGIWRQKDRNRYAVHPE